MSEFHMPRPFQFGINFFKTQVRIAEGMSWVKKNTTEVVARAKEIVSNITTTPSIVIPAEDLKQFQEIEPEKFYARHVEGLADRSSHNVGHIARVLVLTTFLGKYLNAASPAEGQEPLDMTALQYGAVTHDGFRRRTGIPETTLDYQGHGRLAAQHLVETLNKLGLERPNDTTLKRIEEIDTYHDVETRPLKERSREATLFTLVDKMEMVRLFHSKNLSFAHQMLEGPIGLIAKLRMKTYEGTDKKMEEIINDFLPVADALYRLSTAKIEEQVAAQHPTTRRQRHAAWKGVNQFNAVIGAAQELGLVAPSASGIERQAEKTPAMVY